MRRLLLALLMIPITLKSESQRIIFSYDDIPERMFHDEAFIQTSLILSMWAAKDAVYTFDDLELGDIIEFKALNEDCSIFLRFNRKTHECTVEFNARDETFCFACFKDAMDSFFIKDYYL